MGGVDCILRRLHVQRVQAQHTDRVSLRKWFTSQLPVKAAHHQADGAADALSIQWHRGVVAEVDATGSVERLHARILGCTSDL